MKKTMNKSRSSWGKSKKDKSKLGFYNRSDVVEVETWCQSEGRIGTRRDWILKDYANGEVIQRATRKDFQTFRRDLELAKGRDNDKYNNVLEQLMESYRQCGMFVRCSSLPSSPHFTDNETVLRKPSDGNLLPGERAEFFRVDRATLLTDSKGADCEASYSDFFLYGFYARDVADNHLVGTIRELIRIEGCFPALRSINLLLTVDHKSIKLADFCLAREESLTEMLIAETGNYR